MVNKTEHLFSQKSNQWDCDSRYFPQSESDTFCITMNQQARQRSTIPGNENLIKDSSMRGQKK